MKNVCNWVHEQWSRYFFVSVQPGLLKTKNIGAIPILVD